MGTIVESGWDKGWIPSASDKNLGSASRGLLRMDNVTLENEGVLRSAKASKVESTTTHNLTNSIFGVYASSKKYRYLYQPAAGVCKRNYGTLATQGDYDLDIFTGATPTNQRAAFLNALGHVFITSGSKKYKDRLDVQFPLGIPTPTAPVLTTNAALEVDCNNLSGGFMTNWTSVESSAYDDSTATLQFTPSASSLRGVVQTVFSSVLDTTNFGTGTGKDADTDLFKFNFKIADAEQLSWVKLELYNEDPGAGPVTNYYWKEWDFLTNIPNSPYAPFNVTSGVTTTVEQRRNAVSDTGVPLGFFAVGTDNTSTWANIKAIRLSVGVLAPTAVEFSAFKAIGSIDSVEGILEYIVAEVRDTGEYLEVSPSSSIVNIEAFNQSVHVDRSATAVNSQCDQIWYFRRTLNTGNFLVVHKETGALGFTPAAFNDVLSENDALEDAAINSQNVLQPYRVALPDDIIGMIWYKDRIIYLTTTGFIPSFKLDPGTYDQRFSYDLAGTTSEKCLFITKLDVGLFIVATTKDFYRVTGSFDSLADLTGVDLLDVNIYPLGVADPAINSSFTEIDGTIVYISSTGIRSLANATTTLLNGELDLIFRGEARYGNLAILMAPADADVIPCASSGNRLYFSLPLSDTSNKVFVTTTGANPYWRLYTEADTAANPRCMFREEDGTIIYAGDGAANYIRSFEYAFTDLPINILTQYSYGTDPNARKEANVLTLMINTGGNTLTLTVYGLQENGTIVSENFTINTDADVVKYIDLRTSTLVTPCLAYAFRIAGTTDYFQLSYIVLEYQPLAKLVRRIKLDAPVISGKKARRALTSWGFKLNPNGATVTITIYKDGVSFDATQTVTGSVIQLGNYTSSSTSMGTTWSIELTGSTEFEFYEFLPPVFSEETPVKVKRVKFPYNALGKAGRKSIGTWPVRINTLSSDVSVVVRLDGAIFATQTLNTAADIIKVLNWINSTINLGVAWEMEITGASEFEFYEFMEPIIVQECPTPVKHVILPFTNFSKGGRKCIATWPYRANFRGANVVVTVIGDIVTYTDASITAADEINTFTWKNSSGGLAVDWQIELVADNLIEFYEFLDPEISQVCPVPVKRAVFPANNLGKVGRKCLANWPIRFNGLGTSVTVTVKADNSTISAQTLTSSGDIIDTLAWVNASSTLGVDWEIEVTSSGTFEFYEFLTPDIAQICPDPVKRVVFPASNLGKPARKQLTNWPVRLNGLGGSLTMTVKADNVTVSAQTLASTGDIIDTLAWITASTTFGTDWEAEITSSTPFEFYEFLDPEIVQLCPEPVKRVVFVANNLGKVGRKKLSEWPIRFNGLGTLVTMTVKADNVLVSSQTLASAGDIIDTLAWINTLGTFGVDWEAEITSTGTFEFYEFLEPGIAQVCPDPVKRVIIPASNFGKNARKQLTAWPVKFNGLGNPVTMTVKADNATVAAQALASSEDVIDTLAWLSASSTYGIDWEAELTSANPFEFYESLEPVFENICPQLVERVVFPANNFNKPSRKALTTWAFRANPRGATLSVIVKVDNSALATQTFTGSDLIDTFFWEGSASTLGVDYEMEITSSGVFEFYEFLEPIFSTVYPAPVERVNAIASNFNKPVRKTLATWPFRANPRSATLSAVVKVDNVTLATQTFIGADLVDTFFWKNSGPDVGVDWEMEIVGDGPFEFYEFLPPIIAQEFPPKVYYAIQPYTNFGRANRKKISAWPILVNTFGSNITATIKGDGATVQATTLSSSDARTLFARNPNDVSKIDYQLELVAPSGMELHAILKPDIIQEFPMGRTFDQAGPFDLNARGLIYGMRLRFISEGTSIAFIVYEDDVSVHTGTLTVTANVDAAIIEKFPKGIDPTVCRIVLTSANIFYRYSLELKVRITGKESEEQFIIAKQ